MNQWRIAWRNLMRRRMRTWLTILSIIIGVASTLAVIAAVDTAEKTFPAYLKSAFGKADFSINGTDAYFSEKVFEEASQLADADSVAILNESTQLEIKKKGISGIQKRVKLTG
ncbi:ABC transporter permease [Neobacillus sp. SCS-31]|uniref:ABC transporter permease n=1 Tax=Neobacillus oceani TaxID=3115292 RepID=UPI003905C9FA